MEILKIREHLVRAQMTTMVCSNHMDVVTITYALLSFTHGCHLMLLCYFRCGAMCYLRVTSSCWTEAQDCDGRIPQDSKRAIWLDGNMHV